MSRRAVMCDTCGEAIPSLSAAVVQWRRDLRDVVTILAIVHADGCASDATADVEREDAAAFIDARRAEGLRDLARYVGEGTSVTRVLAKVRALAKLDAAARQHARRAA